VTGRAATRADVLAGRAVFFVDAPSTPYPMSLPACARVQLEDGSSADVIVIQAEQGPEGVYVGIRSLTGGKAICELCEIQVLGPASSGIPMPLFFYLRRFLLAFAISSLVIATAQYLKGHPVELAVPDGLL